MDRSPVSLVEFPADDPERALRFWQGVLNVEFVYVDRPITAAHLDLVEAEGRGDASLLLRMPDDTSLFRFPQLEVDVSGTSLPLADEAQMIWDLHDLGGDDRLESAGYLKKWLLSSH